MAALTTLYATDEDVFTRAPGDFATLAPREQRIAGASDGVITAASPWVLSSASTNFATQGAVAGQVIQLLKPASAFTPAGDSLIVDSVSGNTVTMRRKGFSTGIGEPPVAVDVSSITFVIATLYNQIEDASYELNERFNIDTNIPHRAPADIYDQRQLRQACVLTVLVRQYQAMSRNASQQSSDDFWEKSKQMKLELDMILERLALRWGSAVEQAETQPSSTKFGMRMSR